MTANSFITNPTVTGSQITGAILAGGAGRRMDGQDKGLIEYQGRPLVAHAIDLIKPHVGNLLISANRNLDQYAAFGYPLVEDNIDDHQGPLAGIAACMAKASTGFLLIIPCDSPALPDDLAPRFIQAMDEETQICFAATPEHDYPTIALLRCSLLDDLLQFLDRGERKTRFWYQQHQSKRIEFADEAAFANLNTPEDLKPA